MMTKTFSAREKTLLIILVVLVIAALYYLAVLQPTTETASAAQAEIDEIQDLLIIEDAKAAQIQTMRTALEQVVGTPAANAVTPIYDNFQNLLDELNSALAPAENYKLNFVAPVIENGIATRELQLVFYSSDYYSAKEIITKLYSGPYRCDITSFKLAPTQTDATDLADTPVTATLTISYYEIYKEAAAAAGTQ